MMYVAVVIFCAAATPVQECNLKTATDVMHITGVRSLSACMQAGEKAAVTSGRVEPGYYPKIFCRASQAGPAA